MADIDGARLRKAVERAEVLAGDRGDKEGRAVRWSDLRDKAFLRELKTYLGSADASDVTALLESLSFGNNLLRNSNLAGGLEGWMRDGTGDANGDTAFELRPAGQPWAGTEYPTIMLYQASGDTTGWTQIESAPVKNSAGDLGTGWPCSSMARVEFSAQLSTHDCEAELFLRWFNKGGAHIIDSPVLASLIDTPGASDDPDDWPRIGGFAMRPAGAAYARPAIRKSASMFPAINSLLFVNKPQMLEASAGKKKLSHFTPGSTGFVGGREMQESAIGRITIVEGAVTNIATMDGPNVNPVPTTGLDNYADILTLNVPVDEPASMIYGVWYDASAASGLLRGRVLRNGVSVVGGFARPASGGSAEGFYVRAIDVPAGIQTIKIQASAAETAGSPVIGYPSIFAWVAYR